MAERCPTCGRPMGGRGLKLVIGAIIGAVIGILLGHSLVVYYFGGTYAHPLAIIHYVSGTFLGGVIGATVAFLFRK